VVEPFTSPRHRTETLQHVSNTYGENAPLNRMRYAEVSIIPAIIILDNRLGWQ
jgi:hypothetical protein